MYYVLDIGFCTGFTARWELAKFLAGWTDTDIDEGDLQAVPPSGGKTKASAARVFGASQSGRLCSNSCSEFEHPDPTLYSSC